MYVYEGVFYLFKFFGNSIPFEMFWKSALFSLGFYQVVDGQSIWIPTLPGMIPFKMEVDGTWH